MEQREDTCLESSPLEACDWEAVIGTRKPEEFDELQDGVIEVGVMADKVRLLKVVDAFYESIYIRSIRESNKYYQNFREYLNTEFSTSLRPLVRWRLGRPVELIWVRKIVSERSATQKDILKYSRDRQADKGVIARIVYRNGQPVCVKEIYKYISRGKSDSYPMRLFNSEPGWVQIEGRRLEECFTNFRQQMGLIREIKSRVGSINTLDNKYFDLVAQESDAKRPELKTPKDYLNVSDDGQDLAADETFDIETIQGETHGE